MLGFLSLCLPIFAVVGLGWAAVRRRMIAPTVTDGIGLFAFHFALPAMLLRLMAAQRLSESFEPRFFAGYLSACLVVFFATMAGAMLLARRRRGQGAAIGAGAAMGNVGYLGPPLLLPILGERGAGPVAMAIMSEVAIVIALGSVLMAPMGERGVLARVLRSLLFNPVLLSIGGGAVLGALQVPIPGPAERFLAFLGASAGPTALFALGGTLGRLSLDRRMALAASAATFGKLVAYPLLAWLFLGPVLGLEWFWVQSGVMLAAMPTATNAYVLAQRFHTGAEETSAVVLLTTLIAAVAFPATAWLLTRPGPGP
ncbi:AEC family transporter [Paracraurococcus lichenis]|uniref:AEC family transporter n=1 Tax=Paracraurococcus lichenis TaxID=3064888 RepID=A0ABT9DTS1_9PROT|nr:AEC family transporter [Paracraurococcus sp. LOR1-02]MDO9707303.1 AEC family transporter [Paracraurococcus sp. LOR1-02]